MCSDGKHEKKKNRRLKQVLDQLHLGATTAFRKVQCLFKFGLSAV